VFGQFTSGINYFEARVARDTGIYRLIMAATSVLLSEYGSRNQYVCSALQCTHESPKRLSSTGGVVRSARELTDCLGVKH